MKLLINMIIILKHFHSLPISFYYFFFLMMMIIIMVSPLIRTWATGLTISSIVSTLSSTRISNINTTIIPINTIIIIIIILPLLL